MKTTIGEHLAKAVVADYAKGKRYNEAQLAKRLDELVMQYRAVEDAPKAKSIWGVTALDIYNAYPRRIAKTAALKAIGKAMMGWPHDMLLERTEAFKTATDKWPEEERKFIQYPSTWFNNEGFDEDPKEWVRKSDEQLKQERREAKVTAPTDYTKF